MDHSLIYPEDLAPGYGLTLETLEAVHDKILAAYRQNPEHADTLGSKPWVPETLLANARVQLAANRVPFYDFDLAFNYWYWLYQFALYDRDQVLVWDRLETLVYPCLDDAQLTQFCLTQGLALIENSAALIEVWQPLLPALLEQLHRSGVRLVCNHATWMSQGILIILFYHALQKYCADNPSEQPKVEALGLYEAKTLGSRVYTLLGPWITTLGHKLNPAVSDLNAMTGIQALSTVVKVFPDTPSGRFVCCPRRWQAEVRKALKLLRQLEMTPGTLIFETPSGQQDGQVQGKLIPGTMPKAAVRLARSRPNQLILVGMDERAIFNRGRQEGGFKGGTMQPGPVGFTLKSLIAPRPEGSSPYWPFATWEEMEPTIVDLIHDPKGQKIGQQKASSS